MQVYVKASSFQRLCAYAIDILLIYLLSSLLTTVILKMTSFDYSRYNELQELMVDKYNEFLKNPESDFIELVGRSNLKEFVKLYSIMNTVTIGLGLLLTVLYLVILPFFWEKQTLGRSIARIKVIRHTGDIKCNLGNLVRREVLGTFLFYLLLGPLSFLALISALVASLKGRSIADLISNTDLVMYNPITVDQEAMNGGNLNMNFFTNNENRNENNQNNNNDDVIDAKVNDIKDGDDTSDDDDEYMVI